MSTPAIAINGRLEFTGVQREDALLARLRAAAGLSKPSVASASGACWLSLLSSFPAGPLRVGTLSSEVDGIRVELSSNPARPGAQGHTEYVARLVNRAGQPINGAQVTRGGMADSMSVVMPLRATEQARVYRGRVLFTMEGTWELTLRVARDGKQFELPLTERVGR